MRKRNHTVTIRMNKAEYELLQSKVKESGRTQQEVVIKAIADLKIASTEEVEELKRLNQMFADILSQLRGATTNINQIARKLHTDGEVPNDSMLYFLNKNILKYRKESERIWQLIRRLISGQIHISVTLCWDNLEALCQDCHNKEHHKQERHKRYRFDENGGILPPYQKNN